MISRVIPMLVTCAIATGCAADSQDEESGSTESPIFAQDQGGPSTALPEAVHVLNANGGYCTGVLVGPRVAMTAGHCLVEGHTWTIWAQRAPGAPHAVARRPRRLVGDYMWDPTSRDIGLLLLDTPIRLTSYAVPTRIGDQADAGQVFAGVAVGRGAQARYAALVRSKVMAIRSASDFGYTTGLRTEYFSFGGDSGAPLFLVKNGTITHELVGIGRQPEPSRDHDYFTRIDDVVMGLLAPYAYW